MSTNILKKEKREMHKMKAVHIFLIVIFSFFAGTTLATAQSYGLYTSEQINKTKELAQNGIEPQASAYRILINLADSALTKSHRAVESLKSWQFYSATPEQLEQMNLEQSYLSNDANYAYKLSLAYKLTGEVKYADKAAYFINAWASINKEYIGVGFTGDSSSTYKTPYYANQTNADLNMATSGLGFIQAAILIKDYTGWSNADKTVFSTWCTNVYRKNTDTLLQAKDWWVSDVGVTVRLGIIMHHAWEGDASVIINEDIPFIKNLLNLQLKTLTKGGYNIPDMLAYETEKGTTGMWYTTWTLASFTASMEIIHNHTGVDLFRWNNTNGSNMEKALDRYFIYAKTPSNWPYLEHDGSTSGTITKIPQPGSWGGTLYEAMGEKYNKPEWKKWAGGPSTWFTTQLNWNVPSLLQPSPIGTTVSAPTPAPEEPITPSPEVLETGAFILDRSGLR